MPPQRKRWLKARVANTAVRGSSASKREVQGSSDLLPFFLSAEELPEASSPTSLPPPPLSPFSPTPSTSREGDVLAGMSSASQTADLTSPVSSATQSADGPPDVFSPSHIRNEIMKTIEREESKVYDDKYIISRSQIDMLESSVRCKVGNCRGKVEIIFSANRWDSDVIVKCKSCSFHNQADARRVEDYGKGRTNSFSELNLEEVYHSLLSGIGEAGLTKKSGFICKTPLSKRSYARHCRFLYNKMEIFFDEQQKKACEAVRNYYIEKDYAKPDSSGVIDIEVSFDGTWLTRGHKSHVGVGFIIEVYTGTVIDLEVLCNHCQYCKKTNIEKHRCNKNCTRLSGAMEAEEARRLWSRSQSRGFRYITFVGDGDSKAHTAVCELNDGKGPYDVPVIKLDCINHVHKRMYARLMKARTDVSELVKQKSGKIVKKSQLSGKLTESIIKDFTSYYGIAIRNNINTDIKTMRDAIMANFYHHTASDDKPFHHNLCPTGKWCFYKNAIARNEKPSSHENHNILLAKLPPQYYEYIKQVFKDLSSPTLLMRCLKGFTQNPNESIHAKLWLKCPKTKYFGLC